MGYWQNGLEIEKKGMLPYGNAGLIRVKLDVFITRKASFEAMGRPFGYFLPL